MKVTVLKSFSCASDSSGTVAVKHEAGTEAEVPDDLVSGLAKEGFIESPGKVKAIADTARKVGAELGFGTPKPVEKR